MGGRGGGGEELWRRSVVARLAVATVAGVATEVAEATLARGGGGGRGEGEAY